MSKAVAIILAGIAIASTWTIILKHEATHERRSIQVPVKYDARWGKAGIFHGLPDVQPKVQPRGRASSGRGMASKWHAVQSQRKAHRQKGLRRAVAAHGGKKGSAHAAPLKRSAGLRVHSGEALMKHGLFVGANRHAKWSRLYTVWTGMLARCRGGPHHPDYKKYGARGIKVCQRWQQYKNFAKDVGPHPGKEWSLDRWPNNDGNYEPGNWRWATRTMQIRNSRAVKLDTVRADDVRRRLSMGVPQRTIAKAFGVSQSTIQHINAGKIWRHEQQP